MIFYTNMRYESASKPKLNNNIIRKAGKQRCRQGMDADEHILNRLTAWTHKRSSNQLRQPEVRPTYSGAARQSAEQQIDLGTGANYFVLTH